MQSGKYQDCFTSGCGNPQNSARRSSLEQNGWRNHIVQGLAGSPAQVSRIILAFINDAKFGLVGPVTYDIMPHWCHHWLSSQHSIEGFFQQLGIASFPRIGFIDFPVGGMFWARTAALAPLWSRTGTTKILIRSPPLRTEQSRMSLSAESE